MLISIPPADKKPKIHWRLAFLTVASVLVFFLLTIYPIYTSTKLPNFLAILNILIIISITFFSASILFLVKKFGEKSLSNFEKIKQKTKNWFLKNATVQEWVLFSLIFTWLFTATISLL